VEAHEPVHRGRARAAFAGEGTHAPSIASRRFSLQNNVHYLVYRRPLMPVVSARAGRVLEDAVEAVVAKSLAALLHGLPRRPEVVGDVVDCPALGAHEDYRRTSADAVGIIFTASDFAE